MGPDVRGIQSLRQQVWLRLHRQWDRSEGVGATYALLELMAARLSNCMGLTDNCRTYDKEGFKYRFRVFFSLYKSNPQKHLIYLVNRMTALKLKEE